MSQARNIVRILLLIIIVPTVLLIVSGHEGGRAQFDQDNFHVPAILKFARELPRPDLSDYTSATTPLYHLVLALVAAMNGATVVLRAAGFLFTLALVEWLGMACAGRSARGSGERAVLAIPFACSMYVFSSAAWVLPDNAGWLGVLAVLVVALRPKVDGRMLAAGGGALLALVLTRQVHLWAAAPLWVAAWMGGGPGRVAWTMGSVAATMPAIAAVGAFAWVWGGLVPPSFQGQYPRAVNPAAPAFVLALVGGFGVVFAGWVVPVVRAKPGWARWVGAGAALGLLVGVAVATGYEKEAGRWSGIWNIAREFPAPGGRSVVIVPLAVLGGAVVGAFGAALPRREAAVLGVALAGFIAAQSASLQLWQRYNEPFVLMLLALAAASVPAGDDGEGAVRRRWWRVLPPVLLGVALAGVTVWTLA